jgi:hypothetical protein
MVNTYKQRAKLKTSARKAGASIPRALLHNVVRGRREAAVLGDVKNLEVRGILLKCWFRAIFVYVTRPKNLQGY